MKYRNSQQNSKRTESSLLSVRGRGRGREEGGRGRGREREEGGRGRGRGRGRRGEEGGKGKSVFDILESESLEQVKKYPTRSNSSSFYNKGFNVHVRTCIYMHVYVCLGYGWVGYFTFLSLKLHVVCCALYVADCVV